MKSIASKLTKIGSKNDFQNKRDLDLDLVPISTKIYRLLGIVIADLCVKYLIDLRTIVSFIIIKLSIEFRLRQPTLNSVRQNYVIF